MVIKVRDHRESLIEEAREWNCCSHRQQPHPILSTLSLYMSPSQVRSKQVNKQWCASYFWLPF